jgi:DNA replication protein DnaD
MFLVKLVVQHIRQLLTQRKKLLNWTEIYKLQKSSLKKDLSKLETGRTISLAAADIESDVPEKS